MHPLLLALVLTFTNPSTLTWEDFKGTVPLDKDLSVAARTRTGMFFEEIQTGDVYEFKAYPIFYAEESWIRVRSEAVLKHENVHYAISLIETAWCNQELKKAKTPKQAAKIFQKYHDGIDRFNELFDRESLHGNNLAVEAEYEKRITRDLNQLQ